MKKLKVLWVLMSVLFVSAPVLAVDEYGIFELEQGIGNANAEDDVNASQLSQTLSGEDWDTLYTQYNAGTFQYNASTFSGIISDPPDSSIFGGGNKDIQDPSDWNGLDGSVPDKSDLLHAAAAGYNYNNELAIYFTADRYANSGDTYMGFWFFQNEIIYNSGMFTSPNISPGNDLHVPGDVLVLVNFPQASNSDPLVQSLTWDPTCSKKDNNDPLPGDCAATNLRLQSSNTGEGAAVCVDNSNPAAQDVCANTNDTTRPAPWPYEAKTGETDFPYETFFEGGINITQTIGSNVCFATFLAETRASSSFTAQLKDFVIGSFPLCRINVSKLCESDGGNITLGSTPGDFTFDFDVAGCLENAGFGTVTNLSLSDSPVAFNGYEFWTINNSVTLTDAECGAGTAVGNYNVLYNAADMKIEDPSTYELDPGEKILWFGSISYNSSVYNNSGGVDTVTASVGTDGVPDTTDSATCTISPFTPGISVTKSCDAKLTSLQTSTGSSVAAVAIDTCGNVKNTGDIRLLSVTVNDNPGGEVYNSVTLAAGTTDGYTGGYYPSGFNPAASTPPYSFSDTVTATGFVESAIAQTTSNCVSVNSAVLPPELQSTGLSYLKCTDTANDSCNLCDINEGSCSSPSIP